MKAIFFLTPGNGKSMVKCAIYGKQILDYEDAVQVKADTGWKRAHVKCIARNPWPLREKNTKKIV